MNIRLILPVIILFLVNNAACGQNTFTSDALSKWKGMKSYTLQVAEAMPETKFGYKPVPGERTFAEQLLHMAANIYSLSSSFLQEEDSPVDVKQMEGKLKNNSAGKKEVIEFVAAAFDYAAASIEQLDAQSLEKEINFWGGRATKRKIVMLLNDHQTHHRGQLIVYLRLNAITPPPYIGW